MSTAEVEQAMNEVPEPVEEDGDVNEDAEADEGEPDDDDPEAAAAPEPTEPSSERFMEEIGKKLDLLQKHVAKRMGEILGADATLFEECDLCSFWNTPGWRMKGELPQGVLESLHHAMGQHAPSDYKTDVHSQVCQECNGFGSVASGSKVQGQDLLSCKLCNGLGWTATDEKRQPNYNGSAPTTPAGVFEAVAPPPETDPEIAAALELVRGAGFTAVPPYRPAAG